MTPSALCRLFLLFGGISLLFNASTFSHIQGGLSFAEAFGKNTLIAAFNGYFICGILLILTCIAGGLHARRSDGMHWAERLPLVWISDKDDGVQDRQAWEVRAFLIVTFVLFAILPTYGVGHFGRTVLKDGWIYQKDENQTLPAVVAGKALPLIGEHWRSRTMRMPHRDGEIKLRLAPGDRPARDVKLAEVDWFRWWTPLSMLTVAAGVLYALGWFVLGVFRVKPPPAATADATDASKTDPAPEPRKIEEKTT